MEEHLREIEKIFADADFSKESNLKLELENRLFPVHDVTLDILLKEEGIKTTGEKKNKSAQRNRALNKEIKNTDVLERNNPLVKTRKPPRM